MWYLFFSSLLCSSRSGSLLYCYLKRTQLYILRGSVFITNVMVSKRTGTLSKWCFQYSYIVKLPVEVSGWLFEYFCLIQIVYTHNENFATTHLATKYIYCIVHIFFKLAFDDRSNRFTYSLCQNEFGNRQYMCFNRDLGQQLHPYIWRASLFLNDWQLTTKLLLASYCLCHPSTRRQLFKIFGTVHQSLLEYHLSFLPAS